MNKNTIRKIKFFSPSCSLYWGFTHPKNTMISRKGEMRRRLTPYFGNRRNEELNSLKNNFRVSPNGAYHVLKVI